MPLVKMTIEAFGDAACHDQIGTAFEVMFNPTTYSLKHEIKYSEQSASGSTSSTHRFESVKPKEFSLEFMFDGTGVTGVRVDVAQKITGFLNTVAAFEGETHRTKFLKIHWGSLMIRCVLKGADVAYTLFNSEGNPLRAKVRADFSEVTDERTDNARNARHSPNLTHIRSVKAGDTLPLMCFKIYGESKYYLHVAAFNDIKNMRHLKIGQEIEFPPLKTISK